MSFADPEHRRRAIARGNQVRSDIAAVRSDVRLGNITFAAALEDPRAARIELATLMMSMPRWGVGRSTEACTRAEIRTNKRVSELTARQVKLLQQQVGQA